MASTLKTKLVSSLEKVFANDQFERFHVTASGSMLQNERFSFQLLLHETGKFFFGKRMAQYRIESALKPYIRVQRVDYVPSLLPAVDPDDDFLSKTPGLYPDPLRPVMEEKTFILLPDQTRVFRITVEPDDTVSGGIHEIVLKILDESGEPLSEDRFTLEILPARLPEQKLCYLNFIHLDCLYTYYHTEPFSERFWELCENYIGTAIKYGVTHVFTPVFTPPLDTEVGGERPTMQLVTVMVTGENQYAFSFDQLDRYIDLCLKLGAKGFEISHLFTQWGAAHAPKVMAIKNGEAVKIFGWETDVRCCDNYKIFLRQFLPALTGFFEKKGLAKDQIFFHISDEPLESTLENYQYAASCVKDFVQGYRIIDAASDFSIYEKGILEHPIPVTSRAEEFIKNRVPDLWTYYCLGPERGYSNRHMAMPLQRTRILGIQLYKYDITGFLHWGFNYWFEHCTDHMISPFSITDAGEKLPSGDPFVVYPGDDGSVIESIRLHAFYEGLQDLRALQKLELHIGRIKTVSFMEDFFGMEIKFDQFPKSASALIEFRETLNRKLASF